MRKLVTKEGKIFGLINVIDLLVLLFIAAAAVVVVMIMKGGLAGENKDDPDGAFVGAPGGVDIVFYTEEVSDFVINQVDVESSYVYDEACMHIIGKVSDLDVGDSLLYEPDSEGKYVTSSKEFYNSAYISARMPNANRTRFGVNYKKANYGVGHSMVIKANDAKIYLRVYDIRATQRRLRRPVDVHSNERFMEKCGA